MTPFCKKEELDSILSLRNTLMEEELALAKIGEKALYAYNAEIGCTTPKGGWTTARLSGDGSRLVYDLGGGTIEVIPCDFLLCPDEYIANYRAKKEELDRIAYHEAFIQSQANHNYVVTNYP